MYSRVQTSRLYEKIVEQIQQRILDGVLPPDTQLPSERELGEQFGVSRTVVREAIKALREKGLVTVQPGRGTFIIGDSTTAMRHSIDMMLRLNRENILADLVAVRSILEPEIAALAARKAAPENVERLEEAVAIMDDSRDDADEFIAADQSFHHELALASGNALMPIINSAIVDYLWAQRKQIFLTNGGAERGQYHHKRILDAVKAGDSDAARIAMQAHMKQVRDDSDMAVD